MGLPHKSVTLEASIQPISKSPPTQADFAEVKSLLACWNAFNPTEESRTKARRSIHMLSRPDGLDPLDPDRCEHEPVEDYPVILSRASLRVMSLILKNAQSSADWRELIESLPRDNDSPMEASQEHDIRPTWSITDSMAEFIGSTSGEAASPTPSVDWTLRGKMRSNSVPVVEAATQTILELRPRPSSLTLGQIDREPVKRVLMDSLDTEYV